MSFSSRVEQAASLLRSHYKSSASEDQTDDLIKKINAFGGTSEANLAEITPEDLEGIGVPTLLARRIAKIFGWTIAEAQKQMVIIDDNPVAMAARLKPEELVVEYDPNDPTSPFGTRLKQISGGNRFLVFNEDRGEVLVESSQKLLRELLDGYTPRQNVIIEGRPQEVYAVGESPARYADENPVWSGQKLRPDGFSDANVEWGAIDLEIRQLLRIAISKEESAITGKSEMDLYDMVVGKKFQDVARRLPNAVIEFDRMKGCQSLPSLKTVLRPAKKAEAAPAAAK